MVREAFSLLDLLMRCFGRWYLQPDCNAPPKISGYPRLCLKNVHPLQILIFRRPVEYVGYSVQFFGFFS